MFKIEIVNIDTNNGKLSSKSANRRESASGSLSVKPEAARKNSLQRFKTSDKRPRPRGRPDAVARNETSSLKEQPSEFGSVFHPGSKKQSLNHLLNFTYAPRNRELTQSGNGNNRSISGKKHKYVKDHYLQAHFQFIVNTSGDYRQYLKDPDALVPWNYIEQVKEYVSESPSCPICLHPPAAAKITRCGHIYCWSCILHYLSLSDHTYQKCPICFENVCKEDLKSVVVSQHDNFNVEETITLKLMKRNENSLVPYPANETIESSTMANLSDNSSIKTYSKLLLAQNSDILWIINRENSELQLQMEHEEESEKCFIEEAIVCLKERETRLIADLVAEVNLANSPTDTSAIHSPVFSNELCAEKDAEDASQEQSDTKYVYFYQASDGQHMYIHSINVRMLKQCYGSLEHAPSVITAKILAKEEDSITEEYRKRYKYLAHLPITCPFSTIEIELKLPVVNQETLDSFHDELEKRKKVRQRKEKEEKRREKRIIEEENIKLYKRYPSANIPLESAQQFPTFGVSTTSECTSNSENSGIDNNKLNTQEFAAPSFAKMVATAKSATNPWPNLKSSTPIPTRTLKDLSVISGRRRYNSNYSDDVDSSELELAPEVSTTFGDAIAQALQKATQSDQAGDAPPQQGDGNKKKKKNKQKLLFTSYHYSGN
ncbi:hypothetical protein WA026_007135 [Henosepilachna vigintioctopunctata]|uniref:E3 ubiquitin-protein ligase RNF10 n=1 Tax=Henosepilachna vigintioctopunctata TaxID=420089 RepID=A0AAW1VCW1_9CUCU